MPESLIITTNTSGYPCRGFCWPIETEQKALLTTGREILSLEKSLVLAHMMFDTVKD